MPKFTCPEPRVLWGVQFGPEPVEVTDPKLASKCRTLGFHEVVDEPEAEHAAVELAPTAPTSAPTEAPRKRGRPRKV